MARTLRPGRSSMAVAVTSPVRCAVYTRKSTDEGLDRDFNSLDNQRQAAEACIASQRHEGWTPLTTRYDDGGFSGGTTDRPALKRLLDDVERGLLDTIVVYRLDRLSRSLVDFVGLHLYFEKHGVALVSVTESINTTTPHGRMMVNMLLSFAQYERELTAERTRHKVHAARRRGKWTGGMPPLGYDVTPEGGRIVVNRDEAEQVRVIFDLYLEHGSLLGVVQELNRRGWRRKSWTTKGGRDRVGKAYDKTNLVGILRNPLYAGLQKLGDETFRGEHDAIVPRKTWDRVQRLLDANRRSAGAAQRNGHGALLRGLLRCSACDAAMIHTWTTKGNKAYRYYTCIRAQKSGAAACPTPSVPAPQIEDFVLGQIRRIGADPTLRDEVFRQVQQQVAAERRGLRAEGKRLAREIAALKTDARTGDAGDAQARLDVAERRRREVMDRETALTAQDVTPEAVGRALADWDDIWNVLSAPERERVLALLIEKIDYDGAAGEIEITFRAEGVASLAAGVEAP